MKKKCYRCRQIRELENFHKNKQIKDGHDRMCKLCWKKVRKTPEAKRRRSEYYKEYSKQPSFKQYKRNVQMKNCYGITVDEYNALLTCQNNRCAICYTKTPGRGGKNFCIDHDHETNLVRGLLCHACNLMLGYARDDIMVLMNGSNYLKSHKCRPTDNPQEAKEAINEDDHNSRS